MFDRHREIVNSIEGLDDREKEFLYSALNLHGHICGGMPMGYVAGLAALKALSCEREKNMDKFVIINVGDKHAAGCFADGVQFATGCTFGKGVMKKEAKGKWTFMLVDKVNEKAVKVKIKPELLKKAFSAPFITEYRIKGVKPTDVPAEVAEPAFKRPFALKLEDIVNVEGPFEFKVSKGKSCFNLQICEICGDAIAENYARIVDGKIVCLDCFPY
ncbi:formylmethanofuran dehydrogenase [Deferribacter autotrophicus]|uniref:Formylmethanofuran dehydrogenase n=1 Tax=Deferribacter autotrophicus TaxID=500465 RepID=A0A5A8F5I3_9BACT|nr:FmdE family protein [Deferribacter autotrophicus]KAA0258350.1 formylmethanofuran dehydrogenase [Deferribacter autotrophicus]